MTVYTNKIAIVGMAFRFPGDVRDEDVFWMALKEGRDLVTEVPESRWTVDKLKHPKRSEPGRSVTFSAGVISDIDKFDAAFFGISPREASMMDPQQRFLLEMAWEAIENSGYPPSALAGTNGAVYVGISGLDYGTRGLDDLAAISPHTMTGNTLSIAANRLSYFFDLHGPSLAVDTACSSSLVALHYACNSLISGEAPFALVGGINMLLHPYPFVGFTKASMLSADGRCKAFDASGDGYVRAEGGAVFLLKPLQQAVEDGDEVQAVILATGVNADGARKTGITIPSAEGQAELMRTVLAKSGLSAHDVDFIEAHGTGTMVGDPIEAKAIGSVYGGGRSTPLPIGSVKANLGHLEPASAMAGLVKTVLALKNKALPPSLHLEKPNPHVDFSGLNLELVRSYKPLHSDKPLVAGINSFGFGGANAHALLQAYWPENKRNIAPVVTSLPPLLISARSDASLRKLAGRYADRIKDITATDFYDVAYGAAYRRERMVKRLAVEAASVENVAQLLTDFAGGQTPSAVCVEDALDPAGDIAFIYSGNGAQWLGMARTLMNQSQRFASVIQDLDTRILKQAGFSIIEELLATPESSRLADTEVVQPLLFAIQVGITQMLIDQGVAPDATAGHSVGEIAAAWASGALNLDQAIQVICVRSRAQGLTAGAGKMAAVALSAAEMESVISSLGSNLDVEIAGVNSPGNITLSGKEADLEKIKAFIQPKGIFFRMLDINYAFHSRQMEPIRNELIANLSGLTPYSTKEVAFVSTVTGESLDGAALQADYWWRNVREPVRFGDAVISMAKMGCRVFIEIGPHAILQRYINETLKAIEIRGRALSTLRRDDDGLSRIRDTALRVLLLKDKPELSRFLPVRGRHVRLPNYPWQKERHWHGRTSEGLAAIDRRRVHPLLGWQLFDADMAWENVLDPQVLPWLADHQVGDAVVFPGAAYAEMALAAAQQWLGGEWLAIEELDIVAPLVFDGEHARTLRFVLNPRDGSFQIRSRQRLSEDPWTLHAAGRIFEPAQAPTGSSVEVLAADSTAVDPVLHYSMAKELGLAYGPAFQGLSAIRVAGDRLEAKVVVPVSLVETFESYHLHPALLDLCYQSLIDLLRLEISAGQGFALLPVKMGLLVTQTKALPVKFRAVMRARVGRSVRADFELFDVEDKLVASVTGCRFRAAPLQQQEKRGVATWNTQLWLEPHPAACLDAAVPSVERLLGSLLLYAEHDPDRERWFKETLPLLEGLTLAFVYEAFKTINAADPEKLQRLLQAGRPEVDWLASILKEEGLLRQQDAEWKLEDDAGFPAAAEIWQSVLKDASTCLPQLTLIGRLGSHLTALLEGRLDSENFQASLWRSPAVQSLYDDDPAYLGTRRLIKRLVKQMVAACPPGRRLRVLKIAAAPGDMQEFLKKDLADGRVEFVLAFTDEDAVQRLQHEYREVRGLKVVNYRHADWKLELEGELPTVFDVIVVSHTLHRAASPYAALTQVKSMLASGGTLIAAERYPDWSADFINCMDAQWWRERADDDGAVGNKSYISSLLPPASWTQILSQQGFESVETYAEPEATGLSEGAYLMLATRPATESISMPEPALESWCFLVDESTRELAKHVASRMSSYGQQVIVLETSEITALPISQNLVYMLGWYESVDQSSDVVANFLATVRQLASASTRLWVITHGGATVGGTSNIRVPHQLVQAALYGAARVVMNEYPGLRSVLIDVAHVAGDAELASEIERELLWPDGTAEILLADGARYRPSIEALMQQTAEPLSEDRRFRLDFHVPGQLRNLRWLSEQERPLLPNEVEVTTRATGLNFRDVMYLMGLLPDEAVEKGFAGASLGLEFSGVVSRIGTSVRDFAPGDAVMGFGASCFASHVITRDDAIIQMPEEWTFEAAATIPTVFFTVYYSLRHLADLQPGERVLIHGAAGGVGIAAIQLSRYLGAEVFATAGSSEKRDFVSLLGADHVFDSRDLSFADQILTATNGQGVDVVLNSLAGEAIRRNLRILRPFGRFLELGKRDFFENTPVGLRPFKDNISYFGIDADQLLTGRPQLAARIFREVMALFREGVLTPLPYKVYPADHVVEAFRCMQQARHIGKVVVSAGTPEIEMPTRQTSPVVFEPNSTWLVSGGLSGFGLASARWLVERGVDTLVLLGRRGADTPGAQELALEFEKAGVDVHLVACDVADADALAKVITWVRANLPPLQGVLHAAAIFDDKLIANLDGESVASVMNPKLKGAWNLHQLTLDIPLQHFLLYSSVTTLIGNPGQANYVAANAGLESLAAYRRSLGLPAQCVAWGPIADAGYLTRNEAVKDSLAQRLGREPMLASEAFKALDKVIEEGHVTATLANFDWNVLSRILPSSASGRFEMLNRSLRPGSVADDELDIQALIAGKSREEVTDVIRGFVVNEVAAILCINPERIDPVRSLHDLGLDSLMAVELALGLEQRFGIQLPVMMLNESPTADRVTTLIVNKLLGVDEDEPVSNVELAANLAKQHGIEASLDEVASVVNEADLLAKNGTRLIS